MLQWHLCSLDPPSSHEALQSMVHIRYQQGKPRDFTFSFFQLTQGYETRQEKKEGFASDSNG